MRISYATRTSCILFPYICSVKFYRKISSLFCVLLLLWTSSRYYSGILTPAGHDFTNQGEHLFFMAENPSVFINFQKKSSSSGSQGCKQENIVPGFLFHPVSRIENPRLKLIHSIFVVDPTTFTTCKSVILYPYHEFS